MRIVLVKEWQDRPRLVIEEVETPRVEAGMLRIRVHTAAVNLGDAIIASGRYQVRPDLPFVPGSECSGVVEAVSDDVADYRVGDHVMAFGFVGDPRKSRRNLGAFAERIVVPTANVVHAPANFTLERAALVRSNGETAYHALQHAGLEAGETLLILGASGGTGFAALQLAKWMGIRVIASASTEEKLRIASEGGADETVITGDPRWRERVQELCGERGLDAVFDSIGGTQSEIALRCLAWGGRLIVVGFASGTIPAIRTNLVLLKGALIVGANLQQAEVFEHDRIIANRNKIVRLCEEGTFKVPPVARRYGLSEATEALAAVVTGKLAGRVVIAVDQSCGI